MRESLRAASEGKPFTPSDRAAIVSRGCLSGVSICVPSPPQAGRGRHGERCAVPRVRESLRAASERSEEHTSELQSLMRISYAVSCLKQKTAQKRNDETRPEKKN